MASLLAWRAPAKAKVYAQRLRTPYRVAKVWQVGMLVTPGQVTAGCIALWLAGCTTQSTLIYVRYQSSINVGDESVQAAKSKVIAAISRSSKPLVPDVVLNLALNEHLGYLDSCSLWSVPGSKYIGLQKIPRWPNRYRLPESRCLQ